VLEEEVKIRDDDENYQPPQRPGLPALKQITNISVWKILKDMIGKDMTKFCVPVYFNEPITMLQKVAEAFDCENLLQLAAAT
jgi:hypothetical protein